MTATPPTPKRRWFQFRLRSLLVLVTIAAVACGLLVYQRRKIAERREALASLGVRLENVTLQPARRLWL
jgi:hypothetical protein